MLGIGPEWVYFKQNGKAQNSIAGELAGDFMFWPTGKHHFGWFLEPALRLQLCKRPSTIHRNERGPAHWNLAIVALASCA